MWGDSEEGIKHPMLAPGADSLVGPIAMGFLFAADPSEAGKEQPRQSQTGFSRYEKTPRPSGAAVFQALAWRTIWFPLLLEKEFQLPPHQLGFGMHLAERVAESPRRLAHGRFGFI